MSEYQYSNEQDITQKVSEIVAQVQRRIDQTEADAVADRLAELGYVKVVRCRDCKHYNSYQDLCERLKPGMVVMGDGFCAWGGSPKEGSV